MRNMKHNNSLRLMNQMKEKLGAYFMQLHKIAGCLLLHSLTLFKSSLPDRILSSLDSGDIILFPSPTEPLVLMIFVFFFVSFCNDNDIYLHGRQTNNQHNEKRKHE